MTTESENEERIERDIDIQETEQTESTTTHEGRIAIITGEDAHELTGILSQLQQNTNEMRRPDNRSLADDYQVLKEHVSYIRFRPSQGVLDSEDEVVIDDHEMQELLHQYKQLMFDLYHTVIYPMNGVDISPPEPNDDSLAELLKVISDNIEEVDDSLMSPDFE